MSNPMEVPRWRPKEFRLLPPSELPAGPPVEAPADLLEATSILTLIGGAAVGAVGFMVSTPSCLAADEQLRATAQPEIGLLVGLGTSILWGLVTGDTWAGAAGATGAFAAFAVCKFA